MKVLVSTINYGDNRSFGGLTQPKTISEIHLFDLLVEYKIT